MMKKAATLIITGLIAVSLMGQTVKKSIPEYEKLKKHNKIEAFESRKSKRPEHKCFIKHRFTTQQTARLKSTLAVKQGLDSILCEFYNERVRVASERGAVVGYRLQVASCRLQVAGYR